MHTITDEMVDAAITPRAIPSVRLAPSPEVQPISPEEYSQLPRKARRALRRERKGDVPAVVPSLQLRPRTIVDPQPQHSLPAEWFWWERPYQVAAHVFTSCPRLFREWAGRDFQRIRSGTLRQATRHASGQCSHCWMRYLMGATS